jgi:hypothetical protein
MKKVQLARKSLQPSQNLSAAESMRHNRYK